MSNQKEIAEKVSNYRLTGECDDAKLKKLIDSKPNATRYQVARLYSEPAPKKKASPKKKAPAKKKAAKKK